jgi:outer membrane protein OmpA-like peptidoglycan-associated protein
MLSGLHTLMSNQHAEEMSAPALEGDASSPGVSEPENRHETVPFQPKSIDPLERHPVAAHTPQADKTGVDRSEAQQIDREVPQGQGHHARVPPQKGEESEELVLSVNDKVIIPFDFNTNELPEKAYSVLDRIARVMLQNPDMEVVVQGHTDILGDYQYNKKLSELRANTVQSYLVAKGISPMKIRTMGIGEDRPMTSNATEAGRSANRRVEIELQPADHE